MKPNCKCCALSPEGMGALLMRLSLGTLFFTAGLGKFLAPGGSGAVVEKLQQGFADTWLPGFLVVPYLCVLPFVETALGAALVLGVCTRHVFFAAGLLLISLAFGMMLQQQHTVVGTNLTYVFMAAAGAWFSGRDNPLSVDRAVERVRARLFDLK